MSTKRLTTEEFIEKARAVHGDKYDYSKVNYVNNRTKVCIICNKHGEFWQKPNNHLNGARCPQCGLDSRALKRMCTLEEFIQKAKDIFGNRYDYSKVEYKGTYNKVCIICPEHGEFWKTPNNHLLHGQGCPKCSVIGKLPSTIEEFTEKANKVHNFKYSYANTIYKNSKTKIAIECPIHGVFYQTPNDHLQGCGCPKCGKESSGRVNSSNTEEFIIKAKQVYGDKYDYSKVVYAKSKEKVCVICPKHGEFYTTPSNHLSGYGCPKCGNIISKVENQLYEYVSKQFRDAIQQDRKTLGTKELDIYVPSKKLAIEYNGLHWHSEQFKEDAENYHLMKTNLCADKGIRLIHIFEDEWIEHSDIVKSRIKHILGNTENRIFARKCNIKEITPKESIQFLENNSIESFPIEAKYNIGLFYNGKLASVMTFSNDCEGTNVLQSYCTKINTIVVGGISKLLKYFTEEYKPKSIVTIVDKRWSNGDLFEKLGFTKVREHKPNYYYVVDNHRKPKISYFNESEETLKENGIYRIYDCGSIEFELNVE